MSNPHKHSDRELLANLDYYKNHPDGVVAFVKFYGGKDFIQKFDELYSDKDTDIVLRTIEKVLKDEEGNAGFELIRATTEFLENRKCHEQYLFFNHAQDDKQRLRLAGESWEDTAMSFMAGYAIDSYVGDDVQAYMGYRSLDMAVQLANVATKGTKISGALFSIAPAWTNALGMVAAIPGLADMAMYDTRMPKALLDIERSNVFRAMPLQGEFKKAFDEKGSLTDEEYLKNFQKIYNTIYKLPFADPMAMKDFSPQELIRIVDKVDDLKLALSQESIKDVPNDGMTNSKKVKIDRSKLRDLIREEIIEIAQNRSSSDKESILPVSQGASEPMQGESPAALSVHSVIQGTKDILKNPTRMPYATQHAVRFAGNALSKKQQEIAMMVIDGSLAQTLTEGKEALANGFNFVVGSCKQITMSATEKMQALVGVAAQKGIQLSQALGQWVEQTNNVLQDRAQDVFDAITGKRKEVQLVGKKIFTDLMAHTARLAPAGAHNSFVERQNSAAPPLPEGPSLPSIPVVGSRAHKPTELDGNGSAMISNDSVLSIDAFRKRKARTQATEVVLVPSKNTI